VVGLKLRGRQGVDGCSGLASTVVDDPVVHGGSVGLDLVQFVAALLCLFLGALKVRLEVARESLNVDILIVVRVPGALGKIDPG
jgi:hypothetical protein